MLCGTDHTGKRRGACVSSHRSEFEDRLFVMYENRCVTCPKHSVGTSPGFPGNREKLPCYLRWREWWRIRALLTQFETCAVESQKSWRIEELEQDLGGALLNRASSHRLPSTLTPLGQTVLDSINQIKR